MSLPASHALMAALARRTARDMSNTYLANAMMRILAGLIGLVYVFNGVGMVADPATWYAAIPGVPEAGPMNSHFIRDIGFIYLLSGAAFGFASLKPAHFAVACAVGGAWPAAHALFHLVEWLQHGLPPGRVLLAESIGVILPAALGLAIAWLARRRH